MTEGSSGVFMNVRKIFGIPKMTKGTKFDKHIYVHTHTYIRGSNLGFNPFA